MVYKTLYTLILAFGLPLYAFADIQRDFSLFIQFDKSFLYSDNTCANKIEVNQDGAGRDRATFMQFYTAFSCGTNPLELDTNSVGRAVDGYKWWFFGTGLPESNVFSASFIDINGNTVQHNGLLVDRVAFSDASGIFRKSSDGVGGSFPVGDFALQYYTVSGQGANVYAFVYTDEDLSYINTATELYTFIDGRGRDLPDFDLIDFSTQLNTKFIDLTGTTVATSSVEFTAEYFIDSQELQDSISNGNPVTIVNFRVSKRPDTQLAGQGEYINTPIPVDINATTSTIFSDLDDGVYDIFITFENFGSISGIENRPQPFPNTYMYAVFEMVAGQLFEIRDLEVYTPQGTSTRYQNCSLTNIAGCIINALIFLFIPSENIFYKFLQIRQQLATILPFAYVVYVLDTMQNINIDMAGAFTFGNIPFIDQIFVPFRNTASAILWFLYLFVFYKRVTTLRL
jgi:hypothetical protein